MAARCDELSSKVDALFAQWDKPGAPGAAVAVVKGDRLLHAKGYGMADLEHDVPITPKTPFYIASVAKQFTAFAVARLAREGKMTIDDDIRTHLPELHDFGKKITIRHLIHHTSGLREYQGLLVLTGGRDGDVITQKLVLELMRDQRDLNFAPGRRTCLLQLKLRAARDDHRASHARELPRLDGEKRLRASGHVTQ
jgi:CubicO group peptidase (beta-lactamase class C family)